MRGWISAALVVTFLSGGSAGFVAGRATAPPPRRLTWMDGCLEQLRREGVTKQADLDEARAIYEEYEGKLSKLKTRISELYRDQLDYLAAETRRKIQEIRSRYGIPEDAPR